MAKKAAPPVPPKKGAPIKKIAQYLVKRPPSASPTGGVSTNLEGYSKCPAQAFLKQVCECEDTFVQCKNRFTKKKNGQYNKDSQAALEIIANSIIVSLMGHFETYQKYLFGGVFERTVYLKGYNPDGFFQGLKKEDLSLQIDPKRLAAYRLSPTAIGHLLGEQLRVWHYPSQVNGLFKSLCGAEPFTDDDRKELAVLWQLRHSIAHTAASITLPDAQKVTELNGYGGLPVVLELVAVNAICRKLHTIVKNANAAISTEFISRLEPGLTLSENQDLINFLRVDSPKAKPWLK